MLSGEENQVTGISSCSRIVVKSISQRSHDIALTTGRGFKIDRFPDGWQIKPLVKKTVELTEDFLQQRGWQFDLFRQVALRS